MNKTNDEKAAECVEAFKPLADAAKSVLESHPIVDDGGAAFPIDDQSLDPPQQGMSLRDYLADHAPPSNGFWLPQEWTFCDPEPTKPTGYEYWQRGGSANKTPEDTKACEEFDKAYAAWRKRRDIAAAASDRWFYADAMLKARGKSC